MNLGLSHTGRVCYNYTAVPVRATPECVPALALPVYSTTLQVVHMLFATLPALSSDQVTIPAVEYLGGWIHFFKAYRALRDIWGSSGRGTHACLHPYIYFYIHSISILTLLPTLKLKSIFFLIHNLLSSVNVMPAKELCILELGLCKLSRRNKTKHYNYMYISMTSPIP